jgi:acetyl-CoA carboxylase carboxyl transferase subunit alpha
MSDEHILDFERPIFELKHKIDDLKHVSKKHNKLKAEKEIDSLEKKLLTLKQGIYSKLRPWEKTAIARHPHRPYMLDYVNLIFKDFIELHGDRRFADDNALIGGFATLEDRNVMVIGHQKGRDLRENMRRNFGSANPEGYRKALRLMQLAEKFHLPVITFVDTSGAFCGIGPEERGQGEAIAFNLQKMSSLKTPIITFITGEGGSGGALGIAVADKVMMLENSVYSVISPEGCAAILWHDSAKAPDAADAMNITADKLFRLGVIDTIIKEPLGGAHNDFETTARNLKTELLKTLKILTRKPASLLVAERYRRFRRLGEYFDNRRLVSSRVRKK